MATPIVLVSGLPRSGSTLLQNLLAQHPFAHVTATNDLLDILVGVRDKWMTCSGFIAQGLDSIEPRIVGLLRAAVSGFYGPEFAAGKTVFDKSRGHLTQIELWEKILGRPVKVVVPVRDVRDVVASFEKLYRKSVLTDHPVVNPDEVFKRLTVRGRADRLLSVSHVIGFVIHTLQDVYDRGLDDRLVIVPYKDLTWNPVSTINRVCVECGLGTFTCDPSNVKQVTDEDDTVYGMKLHTIRPKVEPDRGDSWVGVLPDDLAEVIDRQYPHIQQLAHKNFVLR